MDGERSDGGEPEVVDEFACAGMLRGSLASLHGTVERIFGVMFGIGADDLSHGNNGQIWLKLQGQSNNVKAAKVSHDFLVLWCSSPEPVCNWLIWKRAMPVKLLLSLPVALVYRTLR